MILDENRKKKQELGICHRNIGNKQQNDDLRKDKIPCQVIKDFIFSRVFLITEFIPDLVRQTVRLLKRRQTDIRILSTFFTEN